jgi:hypothetical protein
MKEQCKICGKEFDETEYSQKNNMTKIKSNKRLNNSDITCIKCSP